MIKDLTQGVCSEMRPISLLLLIAIETSTTACHIFMIGIIFLVAGAISIIGITINTSLPALVMEASSLHPARPCIPAVITSLIYHRLLILWQHF